MIFPLILLISLRLTIGCSDLCIIYCEDIRLTMFIMLYSCQSSCLFSKNNRLEMVVGSDYLYHHPWPVVIRDYLRSWSLKWLSLMSPHAFLDLVHTSLRFIFVYEIYFLVSKHQTNFHSLCCRYKLARKAIYWFGYWFLLHIFPIDSWTFKIVGEIHLLVFTID